MNHSHFFPELNALEGVPFHTHDVGDLGVTAASIGLGSVNNTSDAAKPVSTATQTALNAKLTATTAAFNAKLTATQAVAQANSTATDVAGLVTDFNALLAKLRTAGILAT